MPSDHPALASMRHHLPCPTLDEEPTTQAIERVGARSGMDENPAP
jgi:hypothetical protein